MRNTAIEQFDKDKVIWPLKFRHNLYTVGAIGNIDVDTSCATKLPSFHGTAGWVHSKLLQKDACEQRNIRGQFSSNEKLNKLPDHYNVITGAYIPFKITILEKTKTPVKISKANRMEDDKEWLTFVRIESTENAQNVSLAVILLIQ